MAPRNQLADHLLSSRVISTRAPSISGPGRQVTPTHRFTITPQAPPQSPTEAKAFIHLESHFFFLVKTQTPTNLRSSALPCRREEEVTTSSPPPFGPTSRDPPP